VSVRVTWWSPGRVNLIGDHTDYNDGFALPFALKVGTTVQGTARSDGLLRITSLQEGGDTVEVRLDDLVPGAVQGWAAYVAGTAWALARHGIDVRGADLVVDGSVPRGAGLSSSASLECATAGALLALAGAHLPLRDVALVAQRAENDFVGMPCGVLDQLASTHGVAHHALLLDCRSLEVTPVPLDLGDLTLLVVDTRASRQLVDGEYAARRAECERAARLLGVASLREVDDLDATLAALDDEGLRRRVRHVITENARVLEVAGALGRGDVAGIGPALTASHTSLRDDFEVSCRELDLVVDTALEHGALGARMTGGGFGGSALALVPTRRTDDVRAAVRGAFSAGGLDEPAFVDGRPGPGYGRRR
jgi:galactokinase